MNRICFALLACALLVGCASGPDDRPEAPDWLFDSTDVEFERSPAREQPGPGWVAADVTLVDLHAAAAERLLGIKESRDISPRAVDKPAGELAALLAEGYGAGDVLDRRSVLLEVDQPTALEFGKELVYLRGTDTRSVTLYGVTLGTSGDLTVSEARQGGWSIQTDMQSSQLAAKQTFRTTSGPGKPITIPVPAVRQMHRVAVESVTTGQTAVFQLSRVEDEDDSRILLLFVRIVEQG